MVKSRRMRWAGRLACVGDRRGLYRVLVGRPDGERPIGRPRCRWEDNIKTRYKKRSGKMTGLIWLRIRRGSGLICML